jgi:hypothetical protein
MGLPDTDARGAVPPDARRREVPDCDAESAMTALKGYDLGLDAGA